MKNIQIDQPINLFELRDFPNDRNRTVPNELPNQNLFGFVRDVRDFPNPKKFGSALVETNTYVLLKFHVGAEQ